MLIKEKSSTAAARASKPAGASKLRSAVKNPTPRLKAVGGRSGTLDPRMFANIVEHGPRGFDAVQLIREGFPAKILKSVSGFFGETEARILSIVRVPATTASRLEKAAAKIDSAATERVYRMGAVTRMAIEIFEDKEHAIAWMRQPNLALGNAMPLELMDTEPGAVSVRQILNAIATGGVA
ncbi:antitoxin Xre/MbcA/ParS toxin-binding domain-containing protein [Undibacterium sp.]|jgi:putative toxin-antitoxin system antitoxin component (TIGR02293 family)|uniref:type II RES/Xre toxin-antitoxin system antitoxin n=1 Tax=Undibacterium sp. TaxID=1914977 RepID=UPI0025D2A05E|nr:antitoxin Xre/MbcA/ParS toxin-binding domain-containing protein [Undibacterium sp.]